MSRRRPAPTPRAGTRRGPDPRGRGRRARRQDRLRRAAPCPARRVRFRRTRRHRQHDEAELLEVLERRARARRAALRALRRLRRLRPAAPGPGRAAGRQGAAAARQPRARWRASPRSAGLRRLSGPVWDYRRRARLGAKFVRKKGRVLVGFRERCRAVRGRTRSAARCWPRPPAALIAPLGAADRCARASREQLAADRGGGRRQRHRSGAAGAREPCRRGPRATARVRTARTAVRFLLQPGGLETRDAARARRSAARSTALRAL